MYLKLREEEQSYREELRAWLTKNVPEPWPREERTEIHVHYWELLRNWQRKLFEGGWDGTS